MFSLNKGYNTDYTFQVSFRSYSGNHLIMFHKPTKLEGFSSNRLQNILITTNGRTDGRWSRK